MATPRVSDEPSTQRQYATQLALSAALAQAIRSLWSATTPTASDGAWEDFRGALQAVMPRYSTAAAVVSLDNYRAGRLAAGIGGEPRIELIPEVSPAKIDAGLDWAARLRDAQADLAGELDDLVAVETRMLARVDAAMNKAMLDEGREQTLSAVEGDEMALGFRRVPRPGACAWCLLLAFRKTSRKGLASEFTRYGNPGTMGGDEHWGVFKSRASAGQIPPNEKGEVNRFHNGCHCVVEPIFSAEFNVPPWLRDMSDLYDESPGGLNGFRRALDALRRGDEPEAAPVPDLTPNVAQARQVAAIASLLTSLSA